MVIVVGIVLLGAVYAVAWSRLLGRSTLVTAPLAFLGYQAPVLLATVLHIHENDDFTILWAAICVAGVAAFVAGGCYANRAMKFRPAVEVPRWKAAPVADDVSGSAVMTALVAGVLICLGVGLLFARRVGSNTLGTGLSELLHNGTVNQAAISAERANATYSQYSAAGYTAQFTAVLLPGLVILLWNVSKLRQWWVTRIGLAIVALVDLYFLTVLGGRVWLIGVLAMTVLLAVSATSPLPPRLGKSGATALALLAVVFVGFGFTTILQGRSSGAVSHGLLVESTVGLYDRLGGSYSNEQAQVIRDVHSAAPVFGSEWWTELRQVRPGGNRSGQPNFDQHLYSLVYNGDTSGELPLDVWASAFYNWGLAGVVIVNFLVGAAMQAFTVKWLIRKPRTLTRVVLFTLAGYRLAFWIDPYSLLLYGAVSLVLLYGLLHFFRGRPTAMPRVRTAHGASSFSVSR